MHHGLKRPCFSSRKTAAVIFPAHHRSGDAYQRWTVSNRPLLRLAIVYTLVVCAFLAKTAEDNKLDQSFSPRWLITTQDNCHKQPPN